MSDAYGACPNSIDANLPINLALAQAMTDSVEKNGAIPAWIAVVDGELRIGLTSEEIAELMQKSKCWQSVSSNNRAIYAG